LDFVKVDYKAESRVVITLAAGSTDTRSSKRLFPKNSTCDWMHCTVITPANSEIAKFTAASSDVFAEQFAKRYEERMATEMDNITGIPVFVLEILSIQGRSTARQLRDYMDK